MSTHAMRIAALGLASFASSFKTFAAPDVTGTGTTTALAADADATQTTQKDETATTDGVTAGTADVETATA